VKHKISLQIRPPNTSEQSLLNLRNQPRFIVGAEEDYFLSRILLFLDINDSGMYHYQQCMEKYLKSFLIENNITFRNTHNLNRLRGFCESLDIFFKDEDLIDACQKITPFEVIGRYPQNQVRAYGWTMPDLIWFLDEFVYKMRRKVNREGVFDLISEIGKMKTMGILNFDVSFLVDLFFKDNFYFSK